MEKINGATKELQDYLKSINENQITYSRHFFEKIEKRPISKKLVIKLIKQIDRLEKADLQTSSRRDESKFKIWFRMSKRYHLVLVAAKTSKGLNIITAWNTKRKWTK